MKHAHWHGVSIVAAMAFFACFAHAAEPPREAHGSADAYGEPGVALAWGILRGTDENATIVVARIAADRSVYPWMAVLGVDPFTQMKRTLVPAHRVEGSVDLRAARATFADLPRTEFHFYASEEAARTGTPRLVVYFAGVPDTTPEFANAAALDASLVERIARVKKGGP